MFRRHELKVNAYLCIRQIPELFTFGKFKKFITRKNMNFCWRQTWIIQFLHCKKHVSGVFCYLFNFKCSKESYKSVYQLFPSSGAMGTMEQGY